jgi:hypothetical protein
MRLTRERMGIFFIVLWLNGQFQGFSFVEEKNN